ncbi:MAG TPA: hypothetical protein VHE08_06355, partial [Solirubrobacterales bacterium]|nr:hypothetical protein [Solirubrobacterales bacterium]
SPSPSPSSSSSSLPPPAVTPPPAPPSPPPAPPAPPAASLESLPADEAWRRVLAAFEKKSLSLGAMLAHADVVSMNDGALTLSFPQRFDADRAERNRAEIEAVVSTVLGRVAKLTVTTAAAPKAAAIRSEVGQETDAVTADRRAREAEARQHPLIRRAQDVFGASLKEIKT